MKKGFTLIEVLVTISLLSLVTVVVVLSMGNTNEKRKEKAWNQTVDRIFSAAQAFIETENDEITDVLYDAGGFAVVDINELVQQGLIDEDNLYDSVNEEDIFEKDNSYQKIKIFLNEDEAIDYEYPYVKGSKLSITPLRIDSIILNDELNYMEGVTAYDIDNNFISNAEIKVTSSKAIINESTKKVTFNESGNITLIYSYDGNKYYRYYEVIVPEIEFPAEGEFAAEIPAEGYYELTVKGAPGVSGAKGGTAVGTIYLKKTDTLHVIVGGQMGVYGGGIGTNNGGDSSRMTLNGTIIIAGGGGGGGANSTPGGTASANASKGGAATNNGDTKEVTAINVVAGSNGLNYSGGSSTATYTYGCSCTSTCSVCIRTGTREDCCYGCYEPCSWDCWCKGGYTDNLGNYHCVHTGCAQHCSGSACDTVSYCAESKSMSCSCSTCTGVNGGNGGLNYTTGLSNSSSVVGSSTKGYAKIKYVGK